MADLKEMNPKEAIAAAKERKESVHPRGSEDSGPGLNWALWNSG